MRAILFTALWLSTSAHAGPVPAPVQKALKDVEGICTEVGGKPHTANALKRADLTGDGEQEWILDVGSVNCDGAASVYGDREKGVMVWTADGKEVFNGSGYGMKIEGGKLWLTVSGQECGKPPAPDFASEKFCDRPLAWNASTKKLDWAPVSTVKMVE